MAAVMIPVALLTHACVARSALRREIAKADRDPITGVIRGTEAVTIKARGLDPATSAPACLLIHGFVGSRKDFANLGERLARRGFDVRLLKLPGHGTMPVDFAHLPRGALLAGVRQEYENLARDHSTVHVVGFSMGGALAALLAAELDGAGEDPVAGRLVLASPFFRVTPQWFYVMPVEWWNGLLGWTMPYVIKSDRFIKLNDRSASHQLFCYRVVPTAGARQLFDLGKRASREATLSTIQRPVFVIQSKGDEAASPKATARAFERIGSPDKRIHWLSLSNHHIFWDYEREETAALIEGFLLGREAPASAP
jgi:carboxylesterase